MMLKYLLEKEFRQFFRNPFFPRLVVLMPLMVMLIFPWTVSMDIGEAKLVVVDGDRSALSARLASKAAANESFIYKGLAPTHDRAMEMIEEGTADIVLEIPHDFARDLARGVDAPRILVEANSVNGTKGMLGSSYLAAIVADFSDELRAENPAQMAPMEPLPVIEVSPTIEFNPRADYKRYMIPALIVMMLTLLCGFMPALNVVLEKENGTIEQINVTPVPKILFILAKLIPYWVIGAVVLTLCFLVAWLVYGLTPAGSLVTIYLAAAIYVVALAGFGVTVSNYTGTMQQAMFVMFFFIITFILMSGMFTPVRSMPAWAQVVSKLDPLSYFIEIMRAVYLKGSSSAHLWRQFAMLGIFAIALNVWAVASYRKLR